MYYYFRQFFLFLVTSNHNFSKNKKYDESFVLQVTQNSGPRKGPKMAPSLDAGL